MKYAIFDMDGTLVDSMPTWGACCVRLLDEAGIEYPEDIVNIITPLGFAKIAVYFQGLGYDATLEEIQERVTENMRVEYGLNVMEKPYIIEYLEKLKAEGVKMCILTATKRVVAIPCLERLGILKYFEFFASCDELGMTKAKPDIYIKAAEMLGADIKDTAIYEDNSVAVASAKKSGAYVYGIYDEVSRDYTEEIKNTCDRFVYSYEELL